MEQMDVEEILKAQRAFFATGVTRSLDYRQAALSCLQDAIRRNEAKLMEALKVDLNKADFESYMCEIGFVLDEIRHIQRHLGSWMKKKRVWTPLTRMPAVSFISPEPYGVALIMAPWNYPFQLCIAPLVGALCAGNCAVVKPSAYAPATSQAVADLIDECFDPEYVAVVQGGRMENAALLEQQFDYIFFTGSVEVGKTVMAAAARYLTPVCLELGGKSPCIVDRTADIDMAAKRIAFGKLLNAGQTCIAPDYVLVDDAIREDLIARLKYWVKAFFTGGNPLYNPELPRIVSQKHFVRLMKLMAGENIRVGGESHIETLQIAPTILDDITFESPIMQEEVFGPILPVLPYAKLDRALEQVRALPKPLALYLFTRDKNVEQHVLDTLSFGGGCINDTVLHLASPWLPFGGVGQSGMGAYHGKASFDAFSHARSVMKRSNRMDIDLRYHPYTEKNFEKLRKYLH